MSVARKTNGWVRVDTGDGGNVFVFIGTENCDPDDLPTDDVGTGSIAITQTNKKYLYHEDAGWEEMS